MEDQSDNSIIGVLRVTNSGGFIGPANDPTMQSHDGLVSPFEEDFLSLYYSTYSPFFYRPFCLSTLFPLFPPLFTSFSFASLPLSRFLNLASDLHASRLIEVVASLRISPELSLQIKSRLAEHRISTKSAFQSLTPEQILTLQFPSRFVDTLSRLIINDDPSKPKVIQPFLTATSCHIDLSL